MCFHYAYIADKVKTAKRYGVQNPPEFEPIFHANAFANPPMPVITSEEPNELNFYNWGLIPSWIKTLEAANDINKKTANARSETVFEKPSFRSAIKSRRCIVPASGFYEWRHEGKEKTPYFVSAKDQEIFSFAGIYESWTNTATGEIINSFSILTMEANELMQYVHNNRNRMPVILSKEDEKYWLSNLKSNDEISKAITEYPSDNMKYDAIDDKGLYNWAKSKYA